jgi:hypothetical protein
LKTLDPPVRPGDDDFSLFPIETPTLWGEIRTLSG